MEKHHWILIGGALALLLYVKQKQKGAAAASIAGANSPSAGTTYTQEQADHAAMAYYYPGMWAR